MSIYQDGMTATTLLSKSDVGFFARGGEGPYTEDIWQKKTQFLSQTLPFFLILKETKVCLLQYTMIENAFARV